MGWDLSEQLSYISEYYAYLARALNHRRINIDADPELIQQFESLFLWLQDRLVVYPDSIRRQISKIVEENALCDLFAILSVLSPEEISKLQQKSRMFSMAAAFYPFKFWMTSRSDGAKAADKAQSSRGENGS